MDITTSSAILHLYLQYRSHRDQRHRQFNKFHTTHRCSIFSLIGNAMGCAQEKKTLSLTTGKRIAAKLCTQGCLKRTWFTSEGIFVHFLGVLKGERAHCKNNGRGFFNRVLWVGSQICLVPLGSSKQLLPACFVDSGTLVAYTPSRSLL